MRSLQKIYFLIFFFLFFQQIGFAKENLTLKNQSANEDSIVAKLNEILADLSTSKLEAKISIKINSVLENIFNLDPSSSDCNADTSLILNDLNNINLFIQKKTCRNSKTKKCIPAEKSNQLLINLEEVINIQENINETDEDNNGTKDICDVTPEPTPEATPGHIIDPDLLTSCNSSNEISNLTSTDNLNLDVNVDTFYGRINIFKILEEEGDTFIFENETLLPYEFKVTLKPTSNVSSYVPNLITLFPNSITPGFKLCVNSPFLKWSYDGYNYLYEPGLSTSVHTGSGEYLLPYSIGESYEVIQGENGTFSHFADLSKSIDFEMPEGTIIKAMRNGVIILIKQDSNEHGVDLSFKDKTNFIRILHEDGSIATYDHIKLNGALVQVGDMVLAGDSIAYSGNTGYSTGPHLHIQVFLPKGFAGVEYIPIRFRNIDGALEEGSFYTAE